MTNGYTGWNQPLMVTLTATTNPYLIDRLPLRGMLSVIEMRTDGYAQRRHVTFSVLEEDGHSLSGPVTVDDAEFTYSLPPTG